MAQISSSYGYTLIMLQMLVNTASSIVFKLQSKITINGEEFNHPFTQTFIMFFGEAICFIIFLVYKSINSAKYEYELELARKNKQETKINILVVIVPALCDLFGSCLAFFALSLMPTSVYQMLRGATIVITAIFQIIFLKKWPSKQQFAGMVLVVFGNIIVGITIAVKESSSDYLIGVIFLCMSFFMFSLQVIMEEKYFSRYYLNPFELVGLEGIWGLIFTIGLLSAFEFIPCPESMHDGCPHNSSGDYFLEQTLQFFKTVFTFKDSTGEKYSYQPQLLLLIFAEAASILLLNSICMAVVKYLSALTKNVVQVTTIALVWVTCILIGWENFYWGQLIGFIILVFGSSIYNNVFKIKFLQDQRAVDSGTTNENLLN